MALVDGSSLPTGEESGDSLSFSVERYILTDPPDLPMTTEGWVKFRWDDEDLSECVERTEFVVRGFYLKRVGPSGNVEDVGEAIDPNQNSWSVNILDEEAGGAYWYWAVAALKETLDDGSIVFTQGKGGQTICVVNGVKNPTGCNWPPPTYEAGGPGSIPELPLAKPRKQKLSNPQQAMRNRWGPLSAS